MRCLRATAPGERDKYYDEALLARMDEEQGRRRLSNAQVEMVIACHVATHLLIEAYDSTVRPLAVDAGAHRRISMAITMLRNGMQQISDRVSADQLITIANNANDATITLSAAPTAAPGWVNLPWPVVAQLVNNVLLTCELSCNRDPLQARTCPLYKALSQIPSLQMAAKDVLRTDRSGCPYRRLMCEE